MTFDQAFPLQPEKSIDVLLVGELLIDFISDHDTGNLQQFFGGSPANIALNLHQLGLKSRMFTAIGKDGNGRFLLNFIRENKLSFHIDFVDYPTSYVEIDQTASSPVPSFHRSSDKYIPLSNELKEDISKSQILHFSYWPLSDSPSYETILESILIAKENNILIGFDPNYHPLLDDSNQTGLNRLKQIIKSVDIIKPSLDDSVRIFGDNHSIEEYMQMYQNLGCKLVLMTLGKKGIIAKYGNESIVLPSLAKKVIDSTGAGDSFWSGLYGGISKGMSIYDSIQLGLLCSSFTLKVVGANANLPKLDHLILSKEG